MEISENSRKDKGCFIPNSSAVPVLSTLSKFLESSESQLSFWQCMTFVKLVNFSKLGNFLLHLQNVVKYSPVGSGPQLAQKKAENSGEWSAGYVFLLLSALTLTCGNELILIFSSVFLLPDWTSTTSSRYYNTVVWMTPTGSNVQILGPQLVDWEELGGKTLEEVYH